MLDSYLPPLRTFSPLGLAPLLAAVLACGGPWAYASDTPRWLAGRELSEQLAMPLSLSWDNVPLSRALASLGQSQRIAIVRDRRIDPDRSIKLAIDGSPLADALGDLAQSLDAGYSQLGPVAYLGPPAMAERLRTLAALRLEDVGDLPADAQRRFLLMRSWNWERLAEPRALVAALATEADVELLGAERIPHDLWPESDLPPLSWIDRLTLLVAQFDLTFRFADDGRQVELVSLPKEPLLARTYLAGRGADTTAARWSRELPGAQVSIEGNRIRVAGRIEDHEWIEDRLRGTPTRKTTVTAGPEIYQLSVENAALDKVVEQLGQRLGLEFHWENAAIEAAGIAANQLISVRVQDAKLDTLLRGVFADTGLTFERQGSSVVIRPE